MPLKKLAGIFKLDLCVDYIAFNKAWMEKLRDSSSKDLILASVSAHAAGMLIHETTYALIARR